MARRFLTLLRMLTGTADPTGTLAAGDTYYNSSTKTLRIYDGAAWANAVPSSSSSAVSQPMARGANATYHPGIPGVVTTAIVNQVLTTGNKHYMPFKVDKAITITAARGYIQAAGAATSTNQWAIYEADNEWQPGTLVADLGTVAVDSVGIKSKTSLSIVLNPGNYLTCVIAQNVSPATYTCLRGNVPGIGFSSGMQQAAYQWTISSGTGAVSPGTKWNSVSTSSLAFVHYVQYEWTVN